MYMACNTGEPGSLTLVSLVTRNDAGGGRRASARVTTPADSDKGPTVSGGTSASSGRTSISGGGEGNRTPGLDCAIVALYQLSYTPVDAVDSLAVGREIAECNQAARNQELSV